MKNIIILVVLAIILTGGFFLFRALTPTDQIHRPAPPSETPNETISERAPQKKVFASSISGAAHVFDFSAEIPSDWEVEAIPAIESLNFYDPNAEGENNLEKSQVFARYFRANQFLTLPTVTIHSRTETEIKSRPAVRYDIEKKSGVPNFPNQPSWRSMRHIVTDIRESDTNPSVFFVFGKRPDLSEEIFNEFLKNIKLNDQANASFFPPTQEFRERITKKPFGIFITQENSPVTPERFQGYHTGADVEFGDVAGDVPLFAIADGVVERSGAAQGYGGFAAIRHEIGGKPYLAIYGHLDPRTLPEKNARVSQGEQIGILGDGFSEETDNERKHLHFGIYTGADTNIQGYVSSQEELKLWRDPLAF